MSGKFNTTLIFAVFLSFCFSYFACTGRKCSDLDARKSADWIKDAIIYEVYLRSFSEEGTFQALEIRVPELKKLGATIISLMPIHPIGELNRKGNLGNPYAVEDFYDVNPEYGNLEDFKKLVHTAHKQGLKIIIDLVANQAAWDNKILLEHPDWFIHNDEGAIISLSPESIDVAQLDLNQHEPRKYIIAMMKYWIKEVGIDGFKCIGAESIPLDFWNIARKEIDKIKQVVMVSDGALPEHHLTAFDLTYSWIVYNALMDIRDRHTSASVFHDSLNAELLRFPKGSLLLRFNTITDKKIETAPVFEKFSLQSMKASVVLMFTIPGIPFIYNGQEAGNTGRLDLFEKADIDWSRGADFRGFYENLAALRSNHAALRYGSYTLIPNSDSTKVYSYLRSFEKDSVLIVINFAKEKSETSLQIAAGLSASWKDHQSDINYHVDDSSLSILLQPLDYMILLPNNERNIR